MANRRGAPNLNPYERFQLRQLHKGLSSGLDPTFAGDQISSILQGAQTRVDNRKAALAPLETALLQGASGGMSQAGATATLGAFQAMNPALQGPAVSSKLGGFESALYPNGATTSPTYTDPNAVTAGPQPLGAEDYANIDTTLKALIGQKQPGTDFPYGVHEATMEVIAPLRAQGYSEEEIQKVIAYIHQRWLQFGGPDTTS